MSKGLEALENISKVDYCFLEGELDGFFGMFSEEYNIIKKELKALEIIKETRVDTNFIKISENYDDYCGMEVMKILNHIETSEQKGITQKEYDLLKEVFK